MRSHQISDTFLQLSKTSLILGGARSGKSALAEKLVRDSGLSRVAVVTAEIWDAEMAARIAQHQADRGPGWRVIEAPHDLPGALASIEPGSAVLIDCVTLWLTNRLMKDADLAQEILRLTEAVAAMSGPVVVVSNELGMGIVPENAMARAFRDAQGRANQRLARQADTVVLVAAGLPLALKGALPAGFEP